MKLPVCESLFKHEDGNLKRIADWIFERLDTEVLHGNDRFTFYLCHHSSDSNFFSDPRSIEDLKGNLLKTYTREKKWDGEGFGDLRFELEKKGGVLSLTPRKTKRKGFWARFHRLSADNDKPRKFELNFYWLADDHIGRPGVMGLVRCSKKDIGSGESITGTITLEGEAFFSQHLEASQHGARGQEQVVYLSDLIPEMSIGDTPGCDIRIAATSEPMRVSYDSKHSVWQCYSFVSSGKAEWRGRHSLDMEFGDDKTGKASLQCRKVVEPKTLGDFEKENRLPLFSIRIVGCVFPRYEDNDRGHIPLDFPAKNLDKVVSVVRLPGNRWLYLLGEDPNPYFLDPEKGPRAEHLKEGRYVDLDNFSPNGNNQKGAWRAGIGGETELFYRGEFQLSPGVFSRLSAGRGGGDFPDDYFINYSDGTIGRSPVELVTEEGRKFILRFKKNARQAVFLTDGNLQKTMRIGSETQKEIDIGDKADFILGTTHYKLAHDFVER